MDSRDFKSSHDVNLSFRIDSMHEDPTETEILEGILKQLKHLTKHKDVIKYNITIERSFDKSVVNDIEVTSQRRYIGDSKYRYVKSPENHHNKLKAALSEEDFQKAIGNIDVSP